MDKTKEIASRQNNAKKPKIPKEDKVSDTNKLKAKNIIHNSLSDNAEDKIESLFKTCDSSSFYSDRESLF